MMSQCHDSEFTYRLSRLTFIVPPAPRLAPPGPEFAYASDDNGLVQRITDSAGTHYSTASWPLDHDGDEDFEPRLREPTGFKWTPVTDYTEPMFTSRATEGVARLADLLGVPDKAHEWRVWAVTILMNYSWVGEFKPDDSDEKYRDGVRYVLLSIECNGSGSEADNQEMKAIRDRWGFS